MKKISLVLIFTLNFLGCPYARISIESQSDYKYLKGINAIDLPDYWYESTYQDTAWSEGASPFHYGVGTGGTTISDMQNLYSTFYLRSAFEATNVHLLNKIKVSVNFDDGFVLWINGNRVLSRNAAESLTYESFATGSHTSGAFETSEVLSHDAGLIEGTNQLAIQVLNVNLISSDVFFDIKVEALPQLPSSDTIIPVSFSHQSGYYSSPFNLAISSNVPATGIVYTMDGSDPKTSVSAITSDSMVVLTIHPDSITGRDDTPGIMVRASAFKEGFAPTVSTSRTFIIMDKLKNQKWPGNSFPSSNVNGQHIDLEMDGDIVNAADYKNLMDDAFFEIPTYSIITDPENLFDPSNGIYVNARQHGADWEKECVIELMGHKGITGFQTGAGLRIRGGFSRKPENPKHAFRIFFRNEYGDSKLNYPLFGSEGADTFDKLDLRTAQNYSWSVDGSKHNTFLRDVFTRDTQKEMGQPYTRSRYCHLFLNGMYWGLYQTEERPEASFASTYLGDSEEDYDVIKVTVNTWPYYNTVTDGNMDAWKQLWLKCTKGFISNENYFNLVGKDENGNHSKGSNVWLNPENLIDYMMIIFYTGNFDAPVSAWYSNRMPNNYYAIYNRKDKSKGFIFVAHDSEHSLFVDPIFDSKGINENRAYLPNMLATNILDFQPQWLHFKLTENMEYRTLFADRAWQYLNEDGVLSPVATSERFLSRSNEIDTAIIVESARWGDANSWTARTKIDDWLPEVTYTNNNYFPKRSAILKSQLKALSLYPEYDAPLIKKDGVKVNREFLEFSSEFSLTFENTNKTGDIYITLNGEDPRNVGGALNSNAILQSNKEALLIQNTVTIKARIKNGSKWGALRSINLLKINDGYSLLKVTELNYHPLKEIAGSDTLNDDDFEFIEFKNTGEKPLNLSGLILDSAVYYLFPENTILQPKQFYVIASKPEEFYNRYGLIASGNYNKHFSNSGEIVVLFDKSGNEILSFSYSDQSPWPELADGEGYSLVSNNINPVNSPNAFDYWRLTMFMNGSPFGDDDGNYNNLDRYGNEFSGFSISCYPIPAENMINVMINGKNSSEDANIKIFDLEGRIVYENVVNVKNYTIDLKKNNVNSGVYLLKVNRQGLEKISKIVVL